MSGLFTRSCFLLAAAALVGPAQASTTDWAAHDAVEIGNRVVPRGGSISDAYRFTIGAGDWTLTSSFSDLPVSGFASSGTYSLYSDPDSIVGNGDETLLGTWAFSQATNDIEHEVDVGAGSYYYGVNGTATGENGAIYFLFSALAPVTVPEPASLALAALALSGLAVSRRRRKIG